MQSNKLKVILDINIWISFAIGKSDFVSQVYAVIFRDNVQLIICNSLMEELSSSLHKPKLQKYLNHEKANKILSLLERTASFIEVSSDISLCRDVKDDYLLALARDGKADFLITGDKDLLVLNPFEATQIVTLNEFLAQLGI